MFRGAHCQQPLLLMLTPTQRGSPLKMTAQGRHPYLGHTWALIMQMEEQWEQALVHLHLQLLVFAAHCSLHHISEDVHGEFSHTARLLEARKRGHLSTACSKPTVSIGGTVADGEMTVSDPPSAPRSCGPGLQTLQNGPKPRQGNAVRFCNRLQPGEHSWGRRLCLKRLLWPWPHAPGHPQPRPRRAAPGEPSTVPPGRIPPTPGLACLPRGEARARGLAQPQCLAGPSGCWEQASACRRSAQGLGWACNAWHRGWDPPGMGEAVGGLLGAAGTLALSSARFQGGAAAGQASLSSACLALPGSLSPSPWGSTSAPSSRRQQKEAAMGHSCSLAPRPAPGSLGSTCPGLGKGRRGQAQYSCPGHGGGCFDAVLQPRTPWAAQGNDPNCHQAKRLLAAPGACGGKHKFTRRGHTHRGTHHSRDPAHSLTDTPAGPRALPPASPHQRAAGASRPAAERCGQPSVHP